MHRSQFGKGNENKLQDG